MVDNSDSSYLRKVSEYIHLNPADAGLVPHGKLAGYPWSSYPFYLQSPSKWPAWLVVQEVLRACGIPDESAKSRRAYEAYMDLRHQSLVMKTMDDADQVAWKHMERGWMHGSVEFRKRMTDCLEDQGKTRLKSVVDAEQKRDLSEAAASMVLQKCLKYFGVKPDELRRLPKSDPAKMLIAGLLRYHYTVSTEWVSKQLAMGHFTTVSRAMRFYDEAEGIWAQKKQQILKFIG